jgi:probable phosphoglycerate mutase
MTQRFPQRPFVPPPDATEIVMIRHGASAAAVPDEPFPLIGGHADPPLSPEGRLQAEAVGARLHAEALAAVFVTPLRRTAETAAPLCARTGMEPAVVEDLREVHLGELEGGEFRIRSAQGDPLVRRVFVEQRWDVIPGAEPMHALAGRVRDGVRSIVEAVGPGAIAAAVLHGGVIGEICRQATGSRPLAFVHVDNASISRLVVFPSGRWLLRTFNDTTHLEQPAAKTIDIIGRSTTGSDDAVRHALDEARRTVRNITGVDVVSKGLRGDDLREWRALVRVAFVVDRDEETPPTGARRSAAAEAAALRLEEREG